MLWEQAKVESIIHIHRHTHTHATLAGCERGLQHMQSRPHLNSFVLRDKTTPIVTHNSDASLENQHDIIEKELNLDARKLSPNYQRYDLIHPNKISWHSAAAAAAKSLQSCPTLCDPIDSSPPGSPVPGILQARTLLLLLLLLLSRFSRVRLCATSIDVSPPGSPVLGILQARTLEWVAISFSNA